MIRNYSISLDTSEYKHHIVLYKSLDGKWNPVRNESIRSALVTIGANHGIADYDVTVEEHKEETNDK
jgi:hypothetical protein